MENYNCLLKLPTRPLSAQESEMFITTNLAPPITDDMHGGLMGASMSYHIINSRIERAGMMGLISRPIIMFMTLPNPRVGASNLLNWLKLFLLL